MALTIGGLVLTVWPLRLFVAAGGGSGRPSMMVEPVVLAVVVEPVLSPNGRAC